MRSAPATEPAAVLLEATLAALIVLLNRKGVLSTDELRATMDRLVEEEILRRTIEPERPS